MDSQNTRKRSFGLFLHEKSIGQDYYVGVKAFMDGNFKLAREALKKMKFDKNEASKERSKLPRSVIKESLPTIKEEIYLIKTLTKILKYDIWDYETHKANGFKDILD